MKKIPVVAVAAAIVVSAAVLAQPGGFGGFNQRMQQVLAEPFVGLTSDGEVETGLAHLKHVEIPEYSCHPFV